VNASANAGQRPTRARYVVVALTLALVAVAYLDRVCISTAAPVMSAELGLTKSQLSVVFGAFTITYGLFEMPSGWFADRFGARKALMRIVIFWSAMTAVTGLATGFISLVAIRLLFGAGEAGAFPATARAYARWLPEEARGIAFGAAIMTGAFTGAITQPVAVWLLPTIGWRSTFVVFGAVGLIWALAWWIYFRDDPRAHPGVNRSELDCIGATREAPAHGAVPFGRLLHNRTVLALCVMYAGTIYGWYFYLTWLPTYLLEARHFNMKAMGWFSAAPLLGIGIGVFGGGVLADWLPGRLGKSLGKRLQGLIGLPFAAVAIAAAVLVSDPIASALLLAVAAMFAALGVAPAWTVCVDIGGAHAGIVSGAMNMFGNLGGALSSFMVGFAVDRFHSYDAPLYSIAALYMVAAVAWLLVDPDQAIVIIDAPRSAALAAPHAPIR
jgi:sugar phosphate permease